MPKRSSEICGGKLRNFIWEIDRRNPGILKNRICPLENIEMPSLKRTSGDVENKETKMK